MAGIDPGFSSPCSVTFAVKDLAGNCYIVYNYYEPERDSHQHAQAIRELIESDNSPLFKLLQGKKPDLWVSGHDAFAKKDRYAIISNEVTFADVFLQQGIYLTKAVTDRVPGWWAWKSLIPDKFFLFKGFCNDLVKEIQSAESDKKHVEDLNGRGNDVNVPDHALDSTRYAIMSLFKPKEIKQPEVILPGTRADVLKQYQTIPAQIKF